jgi:hypothetical protein
MSRQYSGLGIPQGDARRMQVQNSNPKSLPPARGFLVLHRSFPLLFRSLTASIRLLDCPHDGSAPASSNATRSSPPGATDREKSRRPEAHQTEGAVAGKNTAATTAVIARESQLSEVAWGLTDFAHGEPQAPFPSTPQPSPITSRKEQSRPVLPSWAPLSGC